MPRFDKYDSEDGGFRGILAADYAGSPNIVGVGINSSGQVTIGVSVAAIGIVGVICAPGPHKAGSPIDVMQEGEIVEAGLVAGTLYTVVTTSGALGTTAPDATHIRVGFTCEASRLIVRVAQPAA